MRRILKLGVVLAFIATCLPATAFGQMIFDAISDFSSSANPNGPWAFGRSTSACGPVTLNGAGIQSGLPIWSYPGAGWGMAIFNDANESVALSQGLVIAPGHLYLHPSRSDEKSVLSFSAPTPGCYQLDTRFELVDLQNGDVDITVCGPSGTLSSGEFSGAGTVSRFEVESLFLQAGESASAHIGFGGDNFIDDSVDTSLSVALVDVGVDIDGNGTVDSCPDDSDGDGIIDTVDNCLALSNPTQSNSDADDWGDACDLCPEYPSSNNDFDVSGIGDECECGDQNGDGTVDVMDLLAINAAIFDPSQVTDLCDTNDDALCDVQDILGANAKVFGAPAYCARYPTP